MTKILVDGLAYGESARWHDGRLWLANWGTGEVLAIDADGEREVVVTVPPETIPFSIDWTPDGTLLVIAGATLFEQKGDELVPYADLSGLGDLFNEIVVDSRGIVFVNGGWFDFSKPGIVAKSLEDVDHAFELARNLFVAQLGERVGTEVGTRDGGVGSEQLLTRRARVLDRLRQHRIRALQLA